MDKSFKLLIRNETEETHTYEERFNIDSFRFPQTNELPFPQMKQA